MTKKTVVILIIFSVVLGYLIGSRLEIFSPEPPSYKPSYTTPYVPKSLKGEGMAFSEIVKAISPTVVNISTTKTTHSDIKPFSHFFDPFEDFFEHFP
jgi:S1-C subfamily serine protease